SFGSCDRCQTRICARLQRSMAGASCGGWADAKSNSITTPPWVRTGKRTYRFVAVLIDRVDPSGDVAVRIPRLGRHRFESLSAFAGQMDLAAGVYGRTGSRRRSILRIIECYADSGAGDVNINLSRKRPASWS